eukprot:scaffold24242_cov66-Phaeocystis_antarctica.AAC.2
MAAGSGCVRDWQRPYVRSSRVVQRGGVKCAECGVRSAMSILWTSHGFSVARTHRVGHTTHDTRHSTRNGFAKRKEGMCGHETHVSSHD